eukprot:scaffold22137_cov127-Isochrysis_galbana.AAC.2
MPRRPIAYGSKARTPLTRPEPRSHGVRHTKMWHRLQVRRCPGHLRLQLTCAGTCAVPALVLYMKKKLPAASEQDGENRASKYMHTQIPIKAGHVGHVMRLHRARTTATPSTRSFSHTSHLTHIHILQRVDKPSHLYIICEAPVPVTQSLSESVPDCSVSLPSPPPSSGSSTSISTSQGRVTASASD